MAVSYSPRILAFAGSTRKESFNKKLLQIAAVGAKAAGAEVTVIDLKDYPLPLFDQDLEAAASAGDTFEFGCVPNVISFGTSSLSWQNDEGRMMG